MPPRVLLGVPLADTKNLVKPKNPVEFDYEENEMKAIFTGKDYKEDCLILVQTVRQFGENVPPLINAYMNFSPSMKTFGTAMNGKFGRVLEIVVIVTIKDEIIKRSITLRNSLMLPVQVTFCNSAMDSSVMIFSAILRLVLSSSAKSTSYFSYFRIYFNVLQMRRLLSITRIFEIVGLVMKHKSAHKKQKSRSKNKTF